MKRRTFLLQGSILTAAYSFINAFPSFSGNVPATVNHLSKSDLFQLFKNPGSIYRPFVRWWWNGDKIEKVELARELRLLKGIGVGGVEINPIAFPPGTEDAGKTALEWLSPEWIDMLHFTFSEAKTLDLTCDLIVGSGWPFGARYLQEEERSQIMVIATKKIEGHVDYEASLFDLLKEADPAISSPYARRKMEVLSVVLVPAKFSRMEQIKDLTHQVSTGYINVTIPKGRYVLYALVKIPDFMQVINGAPGANGPVLNHYNKDAVRKYLRHMSKTIEEKIGPLSKYIRSLFADSLELEGANWTSDMQEEFKKRRGYDLMPYLPFLLFKIGSMGNVFDYYYGADLAPELNEKIQRIRYDFELTKAELIKERFVDSFIEWCKDNNVKSRAQAYGRGYFPLEGSFDVDIPECETWIKYGIGKQMSEEDYRLGRAYTMINKYVSSAAHLKNKRLISCEELTNTDMVFNETLEILKIAADQSIISGVTHPVFHGFNYSPPDAAFPGWVRYGSFLSEKNNWWPYFKYFTDYRSRISALLQQAEMFADIALLTADPDSWSIYGAQNEPFPTLTNPAYQSIIWESIHQNGNACDYISELVLKDAEIKDGYLYYGTRKYQTIFLIEVKSLETVSARKLLSFIEAGGRVFCIGLCPQKSLGWFNHDMRDKEVQDCVEKMKRFPDRFIFLEKPEKDFLQWYRNVQSTYGIAPYVKISQPNRFITQVRYRSPGSEILFFVNSSMDEFYETEIIPGDDIIKGKQAWIWDPENGERFKLEHSDKVALQLEPAGSKLIVYDSNKKGKVFKAKPRSNTNGVRVIDKWLVELVHIDGTSQKSEMNILKDLKDIPDFVYFSGTAIYRTNIDIPDKSKAEYMDLGKVHGVSELIINGKNLGAQWYGNHIYAIKDCIQNGNNKIEVKVITTMGNYLKSLKDNAVAQFWTNEKRNNQPIQSMGLVGPVTLLA